MKNILIINGPNLNLIGKREKNIYGIVSFEDYFKKLKNKFNFNLTYFQSNLEGELINQIQQADTDFDGIILNAGGYSHTSVSIRDAITSISIPVIEVHISNIVQRESFRHTSLLSPICIGCIFGFGMKSYDLALNYFLKDKK